MLFRQLFETSTSTFTYLLADPISGEAVLIDPVLDTVDRDLALITELGLELVYTLETHVHADHVTGAGRLRERLGSKSVLGAATGATCADLLVRDGDKIFFGDRWLEVRETPGHTDGCVSYVLDDESMVFTGDTLLVRGTGRTDFQEGDPGRMYDSIQTKLFVLPDDAAVYPGHDYRGFTCSTIGEEKSLNPRIGAGRSRDGFIGIMNDLQLAHPKRIAEAVPANLGCGVVRDLHQARAKLELPAVRNAAGVAEVDSAWLAAHPEVRIIDVRDFDEWSEGHIDGAELVPMAQVAGKAHEWAQDQPIVLVCRSGLRSGRVVQWLERSGFTHVASLQGGILAWAKQGLMLAC